VFTGDKVVVSAYETAEVKGYIWEFDIPESSAVAIGFLGLYSLPNAVFFRPING